MPRGYIQLTSRTGGLPRVAAINVAWYLRDKGAAFTRVTLHSRSENENNELHVVETEAEIDALIEAAQSEVMV